MTAYPIESWIDSIKVRKAMRNDAPYELPTCTGHDTSRVHALEQGGAEPV